MGKQQFRFSLFLFFLVNSLQANSIPCKDALLQNQNIKQDAIQHYKAEQIAKKMQEACPNAKECDTRAVMEQAFQLISTDLVSPISLPEHILRKSTHILFNIALLFTPPIVIYTVFPTAPESLKNILSIVIMFATQRLFGRWDYPWGYPFEAEVERTSYRWFGSNTRFSKINKELPETTRLETSQINQMKLNYREYLLPIKKELRLWEGETNLENKRRHLEKVARLFARGILDCKELFGGLNLNDSSVLRDVRRLFPESLVTFDKANVDNILLRKRFLEEFIPVLHNYIHALPKDNIDEKQDRDEIVAFGAAVLIQWLYGKDHSLIEDLKMLFLQKATTSLANPLHLK